VSKPARARGSTKTNALARGNCLVYVSTAMNEIMKNARVAKFQIGQVVRHRIYPFRGVVFDIDPEFNNTEEWYQSIPPEVRPHKDQPFYHLLAENAETEYVAYVSEQNLLPDTSGEPLRHPQIAEMFVSDHTGSYRPRNALLN
jgi:heat shock protein HspQ